MPKSSLVESSKPLYKLIQKIKIKNLFYYQRSIRNASENGGDALMAKLHAIQLGIATCYDLGHTSVICESDCLEAVNLIHNLENASLHEYASVLLEILDALHHETVNLVHILREHNICADFMAKEASYSACSTQWTRLPTCLESLLLRDNLAG